MQLSVLQHIVLLCDVFYNYSVYNSYSMLYVESVQILSIAPASWKCMQITLFVKGRTYFLLETKWGVVKNVS